jgi:DNA-binding Lrp family transcriptional regulator
MPKNSAEQLLKDEQKILDVLQQNANESIDVVAKKCGFSRQKIWRTIKKLEKNKTIWGYTVICNNQAFNLKNFTMLIKRTTLPLDKNIHNEILTTRLDDLVPGSIIKIENIEYVHGLFDWVVSFQTDSLVTAKKFCERFNEHYRGQIESIDLLEDILIIRKLSISNPQIKEQIKFL